METMVEMWVWQRKRPPPGDRGLTDSPHHSGGIEVHLDSPSTTINSGLWSQPSPVQQERTNQRLRGHSSTETSDAGSFVGRFRSPLLQSADNASAAPIPGQTARQRVLKVRPAEADQDPEAVDVCLVCSCCSPGYAWISRRDLWSIAWLNNSMIFSLVLWSTSLIGMMPLQVVVGF